MSRPRKPAAPSVGRPSLSGGGRSARLAVPLPPDLRRWADRHAAALGMPLAAWVRGLIAAEREREREKV